MSYQIQDISVQLQGGQNPFIILAQQGSQIASIFGAGGAVFGAIVAVGAGLATFLIPQFFNASHATDKLVESTAALDKATKDAAAGGVRMLSDSIFELSQLSANAAKIKIADMILAATGDLDVVKDDLRDQAEEISGLLGGLLVGEGATPRTQRQLSLLAQMWGLDEETTQLIVNNATRAFQTGTSEAIKAFSESMVEVRVENPKATASFAELTQEVNNLYSQFILSERSIDQANDDLANFEELARNVGVTTDKTGSSIEALTKKLQQQVETYGYGSTAIAIYEARQAGANEAQLETIALLAGEIELRELATEALRQQEKAEADLAREKERTDEAARRADEQATEQMLRREEKAVEDSYRRQQDAIENIRKEGLGGMSESERIAAEFDERIRVTYNSLQELGWMETEHANLLVQLNQQKAAAIAEYENETHQKQMQLMQARFQAAGQLAGALAGVFEEGTAAQRAALAVQKGLAVGEAIMNMHRAISNANAVPWPQNMAAIAQAASTGLNAIAGINAVSFEGGGFTGYGARAGGVDGRGGMPAIVHPNETIIDHTKGGGGVVVNINIQANDTRGFDELLNKRRGMIASMVQSSLNNSGRRI